MEPKGKFASEQEVNTNNARAMIGWGRPVEIQDDGDLRKYRIELPNLYDDSELDPYEFRLLAHYKRVGTCTESSRTTAAICKMSTMAVSKKRKSLHKKGFIVLKKVHVERGFSYKITVVDKWMENFVKYSKCTPGVPYSTPQRDKESSSSSEPSTLFTAYEHEIGLITSFISDDLIAWSSEVPEEWIVKAMHEAAAQNKRNWKYCTAILKRWNAQGFMDTEKPKAADSHPEYERVAEVDASLFVPAPARNL